MDKKIIKESFFKRGKSDCDFKCGHSSGHCNNAIYCFGFIGALFYYIMTATSFWMGVLGVLKAIVWPAFIVFGLLKFLLI